MKKKTRVAIYYDNGFGRNDGPPLYYFEQLKKVKGLEVLHLVPEGDTRRFGKFDYHFWVDWGEDGLPWTPWQIPDDGGKKIYIVSDAHFGAEYRYNKAKEFDYVFFNQKNYKEEYYKFLESNPKIQTRHLIQPSSGQIQKINYLPHAAEPKAYPKFSIIKKYDLCFIGHIQEEHKGNGVNVTRLDALDAMFKAFPNFYYGSRNPVWPEKNIFEDAAKKFCLSRIVFNISAGNDANMRFFETLITGSFLLTNKIPELKNLEPYGFVDGIHYVSYTSIPDAIKKAQYYLEHEDEREKIAKSGYKQALLTGTYKSRLEEILKVIA